jgi:hypothetical protein
MDWRLGAAYFESQLIDYDVCSNGAIGLIGRVGNDPRKHRYFNIQNKRMIMIRIGVSVICGCSSFLSRKESLSFLNYLNSLS